MTIQLTDLLRALGGLGLFLFGMAALTDGLKQLAGESLRRVLSRFTRSPATGALSGAVVTAIVQSSSATTVASVGFVGAGLLTFPQALGITFGANVGTTVTGWLVVLVGFKLQLGTAALPLVFAGALLRLLGSARIRGIGVALAGFALIFIGIDFLQQGMQSLAEVVTPASFPPDTWPGRTALLGIGVAVTLVTQSSSAGVAMALTALHAGAITFPQAAAMVIGMDVGTTVTSALAALGGGAATRRTGLAHVVFNVLTGALAFFLLDGWVAALDALAPGGAAADPELALVGFHTTFNLLGVLAVLPFTGAFARLMERIVPDREPSLVRRLDPKLLVDVGASTGASEVTARRIAASLYAVAARLATGGRTEGGSLERVRGAIEELRRYAALVRVPPEPPRWNERMVDVMHALDHLERLCERCGESEHPAAIAHDQELGALGGALRDVLMEARRELASDTLPPIDRLAATHRDLRAHHDEARTRTLGAAVRRELSLDAALERLDALRWLYRVAYHAWRIAFHVAPREPLAQAPPTGHERTDDPEA